MLKKLQLALAALLASVAFVCSAQQAKLNRELSHLPPPVRKAIRAKVGDGKLASIDKDTEDGDVVYDVEMVRDDKTRSFTVNRKGELLDEEVFLNELPLAVQQTIQKTAGIGTLNEIDKSIEDGALSYDVEIVRNGLTRNLTVDGEGKLLEEEVFLGELPRAVQQTIQKQAAGGTLGEIDKSVEDGEVSYEVEMTRGDKTRSFTVGAKGGLVNVEVFMSELPAALQAAIRKQVSDAKIGEIDKCFDDNEVSCDVEVTGDGRGRTLSFDADGELFSTEEDVSLADTPEAVRQQIKTLTDGGKLIGISKITEDDEISFDVELQHDGADKIVSLGLDGKVIPGDEGK